MNSKLIRTVGVAAILWNAGGVMAYLGHVGALGGEPGPAMPLLVTAAFATSTWAGLAGSIGLALLQRWAAPLLWVSFVAAVVNWVWVFLYGRDGEAPLGVAVMVVGLLLALLAGRYLPGRALPEQA